jgi:hypothetical protein
VIYVDLVGFDENAAKVILLKGVKRDRAKPTHAPLFPGVAHAAMPDGPAYPGPAPVPTRADKEASTVSDSGTWLLLNDRIYQAASVVEKSENAVDIKVLVRTPEDDAALRGLRPDRFRREGISYSYQNDAFVASVRTAERASVGADAVWSVTLETAQNNQSSLMDVTYNGVTPDAIAEARARLLLLDERPGGTSLRNDQLLQGAIEGYGSHVKVSQGVLPALWRKHQGSAAPLAALRLWIVYYLKASQTCEHILELVLGPLEQGLLPVRFRGQRKRTYANVDPMVIKVKGRCQLNQDPDD